MSRPALRDKVPEPALTVAAYLCIAANLYLLFPRESASLFPTLFALGAVNLLACELAVTANNPWPSAPYDRPAFAALALAGWLSIIRTVSLGGSVEVQRIAFYIWSFIGAFGLGVAAICCGVGCPSGGTDGGQALRTAEEGRAARLARRPLATVQSDAANPVRRYGGLKDQDRIRGPLLPIPAQPSSPLPTLQIFSNAYRQGDFGLKGAMSS
ncbi:hypothetical protein JCM10207_008345 [Rhodosporidiobolus poonsookiae]